MEPKQYFLKPKTARHRQFEALRAFYVEGLSAAEAAEKFGYTLSTFYSMVRDFKSTLNVHQDDPFFSPSIPGRKPKDMTGELKQLIISLRKKYLSVPDITSILQSMGHVVSERYVYDIITGDGFARLPRRNIQTKKQASSTVKLKAPKVVTLDYTPERFTSQNALGALCLLPYMQKYGIMELIKKSNYPETNALDNISSILSFIALKLSNARRYTADDAWCMDRGLGLFAGLNVLPKAAWFTSYSHRVTRDMNLSFLRGLHNICLQHGLLSDTANLDFTTIPSRHDDSGA